MSDERKTDSSIEVFRMVLVHHSGAETVKIVAQRPDLVGTVIENLMQMGVVREVRFEPAPGEKPGPIFPPEKWAGFEPLEVDDELPPLDRPKIA